MTDKKISRALISAYSKDQLEPVIHALAACHVEFVSTGGTQAFIEKLGYAVTPVETLTGFPSIFGGRVKTLHPVLFGGILYRRDHEEDARQAAGLGIAPIDLVLVDLYPFEETVAAGGTEPEVIEKIDIGGISLLRAAAKNWIDVLVVSSRSQYAELSALLSAGRGSTTAAQRRLFAAQAFDVTSHYDTAIFNWLNRQHRLPRLKESRQKSLPLRYGENPHQQGVFYGDLPALFDQLHGRELSYNNLVDTDAAVHLVQEFAGETAFVIIKHTNACGAAVAADVREAYRKALQADPLSAFGGVLATNQPLDREAAEEINKLFFEILVAPDFSAEALALLQSKKNRILLRQKDKLAPARQVKTLLNGFIEQDIDWKTDAEEDLKIVTQTAPTPSEIRALLFASKICKHTKSNAIVLATPDQLLASGTGQTSRVDALKQAIEKARRFNLPLTGAAMASDAFFPFPDCVELAWQAGIRAVVQPGGSVKDQDSIDFCNAHGMAMAFTGFRHFKH
jgi:phosphoribosylaminoimidazolecarboxamide formyltransferase/IMP cyclohydrolase